MVVYHTHTLVLTPWLLSWVPGSLCGISSCEWYNDAIMGVAIHYRFSTNEAQCRATGLLLDLVLEARLVVSDRASLALIASTHCRTSKTLVVDTGWNGATRKRHGSGLKAPRNRVQSVLIGRGAVKACPNRKPFPFLSVCHPRHTHGPSARRAAWAPTHVAHKCLRSRRHGEDLRIARTTYDMISALFDSLCSLCDSHVDDLDLSRRPAFSAWQGRAESGGGRAEAEWTATPVCVCVLCGWVGGGRCVAGWSGSGLADEPMAPSF
ncbi:hypothetical protein B0T24DRAFT_51093 [Lasiosphaeria ovina]|uniref:Uncharacterized protein n=1 Tax=Lasiosphaeria ovina TaxID=92902 RepID=A0AAE0TXW4_9PEZI|nr:hypothetical protein B0T24DRAFT_51093 [Lasiosphaeria ovina]